jgi:hypothetical protein
MFVISFQLQSLATFPELYCLQFVIFVFNMKTPIYIIVLSLLLVASCKKDDSPKTSGTATIDSVRDKDYNIKGFSFSSGQIVSTNSDPGPDITVDSITVSPYHIMFQTNNFQSSFFKYGEYPDKNSAKAAFDNLNSVNVAEWTDIAVPVLLHQVWVYRSRNDKYSKILITNITRRNEMNTQLNRLVAVVEVTFEWSHQPDGSLNFP